jgi:hypothetical protein
MTQDFLKTQKTQKNYNLFAIPFQLKKKQVKKK